MVPSFVPFSLIFGEAVAGYLHHHVARIGGFSGLIASVPFAVILVEDLIMFGSFIPAAPGPNAAQALLVLVMFVMLAVLFVTAVKVELGAVSRELEAVFAK